ncbi:MAG TPA: cation diffusion facilitator family transporter [Lapillicoccus sp.]|nr:cation diffusion facilitator family transporter [Lapillicoccus sp.]
MRDQRLLLLSVWVSAGFAVVSSVWGILSGSSMIVFDGLYSFASVGLSVLAVMALRFARRGPDDRFPWGREAAEPVVVIVKAGILAALCAYAAVQGVVDIVAGGRDVEVGWAIAYAALATVVGLVVGLVLRRGAGSDLVKAEAAEWLGDALLSALVLVGFVVALVLVRSGREDLAAYVDPAMVVLGSVVFLAVPVRLVIDGMRELLVMSPPATVLDSLQSAVDEVRERYAFDDAVLRASKVGGRVDVEIAFVVGEPSPVRTVADCDEVRSDLYARLEALGYERSMSVSFTRDPRWAV